MSHVSVSCRCGHTAGALMFEPIDYGELHRRVARKRKPLELMSYRPAPPPVWQCPSCGVRWRVNPKVEGRIEILGVNPQRRLVA